MHNVDHNVMIVMKVTGGRHEKFPLKQPWRFFPRKKIQHPLYFCDLGNLDMPNFMYKESLKKRSHTFCGTLRTLEVLSQKKKSRTHLSFCDLGILDIPYFMYKESL